MGSVYGFEVDSELPLRRLRPGGGPRGVLRIRRGPDSLLDERGSLTVLHDEPLPQGAENRFAIASVPGGLIVACQSTGGYRLDPDGLTVTVSPRGRQDGWEHRLLAVVVPLLLAERGDLVVHAAAVELDGGALVIAGPTTAGKSTLAMAFAELGNAVLSEDGAVIDRDGRGLVWPAAAGIRVREPGAVTAPRRVKFVGDPDVPALPPRALVLLGERGDSLEVAPLSHADGLMALAPNLVHSGGQAGLGPAFAALASLLGRVPAFRASMPDDLDAVEDSARALALRVACHAQPAGA